MEKLNKLDDSALISMYLKGDENCLSILINRHEERVFAFIMSKIKDPNLSEDFFQDTFIKVINTLKLGKYNEEGKFLPWVMRIAHNLIIDYFRKNKRFKTVHPKGKNHEDLDIFDTIDNQEKNANDLMEDQQIKSDIKELIDLLPEEQREVILLRHYYDMSFKEISKYSNVSINTALGRMRYAIINLRKLAESNKRELLV